MVEDVAGRGEKHDVAGRAATALTKGPDTSLGGRGGSCRASTLRVHQLTRLATALVISCWLDLPTPEAPGWNAFDRRRFIGAFTQDGA